MATKGAHKRLVKEYMAIKANPPDYIIARPLESNILEWHYVITGPPGSPYEGGSYHGKVVFPPDYPYKPPSIKMLTPNGRFQTDYRLCLSMSDYHPKTWNPAWSVATILTGLLSFMLEDAATTGSIKTTEEEKRMYARKSQAWNLANPKFRDIFPDLCTEQPPKSATPTPASPSTTSQPAQPLATELKRRNQPQGESSTQPAANASSSTTAAAAAGTAGVKGAPATAGGGGGVNGVVADLWQGVRSNLWRGLLLGVFVYLVVAKVLSRVNNANA